jgi:hypothetical protein
MSLPCTSATDRPVSVLFAAENKFWIFSCRDPSPTPSFLVGGEGTPKSKGWAVKLKTKGWAVLSLIDPVSFGITGLFEI